MLGHPSYYLLVHATSATWLHIVTCLTVRLQPTTMAGGNRRLLSFNFDKHATKGHLLILPTKNFLIARNLLYILGGRATLNLGSPQPYLEGPHRSAGSSSRTRRATPKRGSPYPKLRKPHRSVGIGTINSNCNTELCKYISLTRKATAKHGNPKKKPEKVQQNCGSEI